MFGAFNTFGKLGAIGKAIAAAWSPLSLWPDGIDSPGMWISPRTLDSQWQDYTGTTPVDVPGTVADSSNPVGLALDIRAGAPTTLGPELWNNQTPKPADAVLIGTNQYEILGAGSDYMFNWISLTGQVSGATYLWEITITGLTSGAFVFYCGGVAGFSASANGVFQEYIGFTGNGINCLYTANIGARITFSVKEVPGNHMLQSTSAARPLLSGRVNLLTYTEDFSHTWGFTNGDIATTSKLAAAANSSAHGVRCSFLAISNPEFTVRASAAEYGFLHLVSGPGISPIDGVSFCATFDLANGTVIKDGSWGTSAQIVAVGGGLYDCSVVSIFAGCVNAVICYSPTADTNTYLGDGVSGVNVFRAQISYQDTPYQSVPGNGSTYDATAITPFQLYDGVDDGMATASFAAGTLTSGMDCMIAVRRDSGTVGIAGLSDGAANNKFFGFYHDIDNVYANYLDCGTPTTWVDGVQLTGGTATTRAALYTALADSGWHVAEWRGLDLSGWTAAAVSAFLNTYRLNGAQGGILLFPSSTSTADRDAARTWLGAKVGLTL